VKQLRLFYRTGCHLCEDMQAHLEGLKASQPFHLEPVDVDRDRALKQRYDHRVPVLEDKDGTTLSEYYLDQQAVLRYLQGA
jgi:glutathione S-transferase